ncbi:MAG: M48 family metallopeptidase [Gammaproteobacteria bacterium]|nr:M48 family metallopeptidase [Gammaproteobacteria bacterium]
MDFFSQQHQARTKTRKLLVYLLLAIASLLAITHGIFYLLLSYDQAAPDRARYFTPGHYDLATYVQSGVFWIINLAILVVIGFASLYKWLTIRAGGYVIAEHLGGVLIPNTTADLNEKRVLNVVQEMAIASGTPVPPVYILEEDGINAFAAGYTPADAVIGITRGAITRFNREQLQGVIGHEFSHIFHGDMRLNLQLIALLHGILVIGLLGYYAMRVAGNSRGRGAAGLLGIGIALIILGYGGTFFGNLIKAAVSRQREFLADASAVQFTRNPEGIAGALKIIGASSGSVLTHARVDEVTHLLFAEGKHFATDWWATHPPLETRIRRIEPRWDGIFITPAITTSTTDQSPPPRPSPMRPAEGLVAAAAVLSSVNRIGTIDSEHLGYSQQLLQQLPATLIALSQTPASAAELILAQVLLRTEVVSTMDPATQQLIQAKQTEYASQLQLLTALPDPMRLPLLDLCVASLKQGTAAQYQQFMQVLDQFIGLDKKISLFEWCLKRVVDYQLKTFFYGPVQPSKLLRLSDCRNELSIVLSLLAQFDTGKNPAAIIKTSADTFHLTGLQALPPEQLSAASFEVAVDRLGLLHPMDKPSAIKACAQVITYDRQISVREVEVLRALASSWDCPMPPILPNQT